VALATEAINRLLQTGFAYYKRAEGHDLKTIMLLCDMALVCSSRFSDLTVCSSQLLIVNC